MTNKDLILANLMMAIIKYDGWLQPCRNKAAATHLTFTNLAIKVELHTSPAKLSYKFCKQTFILYRDINHDTFLTRCFQIIAFIWQTIFRYSSTDFRIQHKAVICPPHIEVRLISFWRQEQGAQVLLSHAEILQSFTGNTNRRIFAFGSILIQQTQIQRIKTIPCG